MERGKKGLEFQLLAKDDTGARREDAECIARTVRLMCCGSVNFSFGSGRPCACL